jgi:hypothetical protein
LENTVTLVSKRIATADAFEAIEYFYENNLTDGLPVVPPTADRVEQFLAKAQLEPDHVIGEVRERARVITAEKLAINAVMAGCLPEYMPVLVAAVEAVCDPRFKFNHLASMGSPWPLFIVSGPIVDDIEMHHGMYLFGSGNRANSTIGRAMNLVLWNSAELRPDAIQRGQLGSPQRFSACIAENPATAWVGLNEWEGFGADDSTVTAFSGYYFCMARTEATEPEDMLAPLVNSIARHEFSRGTFVVVIPPNFEELFVEQGWTKERIRDHIFETCKRSVKDLKEDGRWGRLSSTFGGDLKKNIAVEPGDEDDYIHLFKTTNPREDVVFHQGAINRRADVLIVAAGGDAGLAYGILQPYSQSTDPVTKQVQQPAE